MAGPKQRVLQHGQGNTVAEDLQEEHDAVM